jgi:hypothetical protein
MHKLDNTPFAIVIVRTGGQQSEPVGMYRGRSHVKSKAVTFESLDGKLDIELPDSWLRTIRSVPAGIAEDLGHAEYFITVNSDDWVSG